MESRDKLYAELVKATKRANQRLVRLEQRHTETPAYKIALNDITTTLGKKSGIPRFSVRKGMTFNEIERELKYTNKFLKSASSTTVGMKAVVKKRSKTLSKKFGATRLNELFTVLSSESFKRLSELVPSAMIVQSVSDALNNGASSADIKSTLADLISRESDEFLVDSMNSMLEEL